MYQVEKTMAVAIDEARRLSIVLEKTVLILKITEGMNKGYGDGVGYEVATWDDYLIDGHDPARVVRRIDA